jgi:hypothetical protein
LLSFKPFEEAANYYFTFSFVVGASLDLSISATIFRTSAFSIDEKSFPEMLQLCAKPQRT